MQFTDIAKHVIFRKSDVIDKFRTDAAFRHFIQKTIKDNLIRRIRRDMYAVVDPTTGDIYASKYLIASSISQNAYLVYHSAIEYHGLANQVYHVLTVAEDAKFNNFEHDGIEYQFVKSPINGFIEKINHGAILKVTSKERTIIDCIANMKMSGGISEILGALDLLHFLDETKLMECLKAYAVKGLYKKVGYLLKYYQDQLSLSDNFFTFCMGNMSKSIEYLLKESVSKSILQIEWALMAPSYADLQKLVGGGF